MKERALYKVLVPIAEGVIESFRVRILSSPIPPPHPLTDRYAFSPTNRKRSVNPRKKSPSQRENALHACLSLRNSTRRRKRRRGASWRRRSRRAARHGMRSASRQERNALLRGRRGSVLKRFVLSSLSVALGLILIFDFRRLKPLSNNNEKKKPVSLPSVLHHHLHLLQTSTDPPGVPLAQLHTAPPQECTMPRMARRRMVLAPGRRRGNTRRRGRMRGIRIGN